MPEMPAWRRKGLDLTTTKTVTKRDVIEVARKRWPGCRLDEHQGALKNDAGREAYKAERKQRQKRIEEIKAIVEPPRKKNEMLKALAEAARFVVDVNGDEPSIPKLASAVERAEQFIALIEERDEIYAARDAGSAQQWYRYQIMEVGPIGGWRFGEAADTLAELLAKITNTESTP